MRLKTAQTDACQKALIRGGFKIKYSSQWLRLGGDNLGEVYDVWFLHDGFIEILKGTVAASKTSRGFVNLVNWDYYNTIILKLA